MEERRNLLSKTQSFYLSKKKISVMEMVPKKLTSCNNATPGEDLSRNLSTWSASLKNKSKNSKYEIRAKLALLRSNSVDKAKRR